MLREGGVLRQSLWLFVFWVGCVSKPLEEGTVGADPIVTDPIDTDGGSGVGGGETGGTDVGGGTDDTGSESGGGETEGDEGGEDIDCDEIVEQDPVDECVMRPLMCDRERPLLSTTKRSPSNWDTSEYIAWTCLVTDDPYDGPETVFHFEHPGTGNIEIQLHAPCEELDLFAVRWPDWSDDGDCPAEENAGSLLCEGSHDSGDDTLTLFENVPVDYLIVVDGPEGERTNFTIVAECP